MHQVEGPDILQRVRSYAESNKNDWAHQRIWAFELLGTTGAGKTALLETILPRFKEMGIDTKAILGDVAGRDDEERLRKKGIKAVTVQTGKDCHLSPHSVGHAVEKLVENEIKEEKFHKNTEKENSKNRSIIFIENVGNLVCPADFPLGAQKRIAVISVTEGDDMVRKHPMIFTVADAVVINKIELAEYVGVKIERILEDLQELVPFTPVFLTDVKTGKGIPELFEYILKALNPLGNAGDPKKNA